MHAEHYVHGDNLSFSSCSPFVRCTLMYRAGDNASRLEVVKGDVTDPSTLPAALTDAAGVIFAASGKGFWSAKPVDNEVCLAMHS